MKSQALRTKEQFGCAQHEGIATSIEHVAQDDVHELVEEKGRGVGHACAHQMQISRLNGWMCEEKIPPCEQDSPILARITVRDCIDLSRRDTPARIVQQ